MTTITNPDTINSAVTTGETDSPTATAAARTFTDAERATRARHIAANLEAAQLVNDTADATLSGAARDGLTIGQIARLNGLIRTQRTVAQLITNGAHLDPAGNAAVSQFVKNFRYIPQDASGIELARDRWSNAARRCHQWRGHTASLRAEDRPTS
jgi:hypothetical protein